MNKKIAFSLIVGFLFSLAAALITSNSRYYMLKEDSESGQNKRIEISSLEYSSQYSAYSKETKYNSTIILVSLIGGIGVGYLLTSFLESIAKEYKIEDFLKKIKK